jgi:hypothetical protein
MSAGGRPRKGSEAGTNKARRPWEAEGLSERAWYRRREEQRMIDQHNRDIESWDRANPASPSLLGS